MDRLIALTLEYGLPILIIACAIIVVVGLLKLCKVFSKIQNKGVKKFLYYFIDIALSFAGTAIYFTITKTPFIFSDYLAYSLAQITFTVALYAAYENFHIRGLVQIILGCIAGWFKKNPNNKIAKALKAMGLDEAAITRVQNNANAELERAKNTQTK
jgi:hypothetical protein